MSLVLDHIHARRMRDADAIATQLHPDVVHQGIRSDVICVGREEVMHNIRRGMMPGRFEVTRLELIDAGADAVVVGIAGPQFTEQAGVPLNGELFVRFCVQDGSIVRMDDFADREAALTARR
jgi:ketosteroid isomerase-like protein